MNLFIWHSKKWFTFYGLILNRFMCTKEGLMMHKGFLIKEKDHKWRCGKFQCSGEEQSC